MTGTINIDSISVSENNISDTDIDNAVLTDVAKVLGMEIKENEEYSLVFGEELASFDIVYKSKDNEKVLNEKFEDMHELTVADMSNTKLIEIPDETALEAMSKAEQKAEEAIEVEKKVDDLRQKNIEKDSVDIDKAKELELLQQDALLLIDKPDTKYNGTPLNLSDSDRMLLERLVMGEAGGEGIEGAALVAQAIRDTMVYKGFDSVEEVRQALKYSGSIKREPNQNVKDAVSFIFDNGGYAVRHKIFYFYAPKRVSSSFHESQKFIIEYGGHRFFSVNE